MLTSNEIVLRPRFKMELKQNNQSVLQLFEASKTNQKAFVVTRVNDHVFIRLPKLKQHFWTPELHLEINEIDDSSSMLHGLFGPKPSIWTMFMFFHFIVAGIFIAFGIWAYSNWSLETDYFMQLIVVFMMVFIWFVLYFAGRLGRASGKPEMHQLYNFMLKILNN